MEILKTNVVMERINLLAEHLIKRKELALVILFYYKKNVIKGIK